MWSEIRADYGRYPGTGVRRLGRALVSQGFWAVTTFRVAHAIWAVNGWMSLPLKIVWLPFQKLIECATGIQIGVTARVGPGLYIGHFGCIIVSSHAVIGTRCNVSQGVTIGVGTKHGRRGVPVLGDRVYVAPGAKLFGPIRINNDSAIGANAVVNDDVAEGVTVAGVPAKVVSTKGSQGLIEVAAITVSLEEAGIASDEQE